MPYNLELMLTPGPLSAAGKTPISEYLPRSSTLRITNNEDWMCLQCTWATWYYMNSCIQVLSVSLSSQCIPISSLQFCDLAIMTYIWFKIVPESPGGRPELYLWSAITGRPVKGSLADTVAIPPAAVARQANADSYALLACGWWVPFFGFKNGVCLFAKTGAPPDSLDWCAYPRCVTGPTCVWSALLRNLDNSCRTGDANQLLIRVFSIRGLVTLTYIGIIPLSYSKNVWLFGRS